MRVEPHMCRAPVRFGMLAASRIHRSAHIFRHFSGDTPAAEVCSAVTFELIRKSEVPQPSTDANGLILKSSFAIAENMHQNVIAFHAANGMLNKDTDLTASDSTGFSGKNSNH